MFRVGQKQSSETFELLKGNPEKGIIGAEDFKQLVNSLGAVRALKMLDGDEHADLMTVDELFARWIEWKGERGKDGELLRIGTERTLNDYRRDYKNWIQPWLGHLPAETVDEGDVQKLVDHMLGQLARKSVLDRHMIVHSMFDWGKAKSRRLVTHNPCLETEFPKRKKKPPRGTTVPQYRSILEAAYARNPDAADLICFLGETGWRWSEAAALAVEDVEDDGIDVWVTVGAVFRINGRWQQIRVKDEAKSYRAFRRIRMFPESAEVVRRRIKDKASGDLVFTNSRGRQWNQNTFLRDTWPRIVQDAGLYEGPRKSPTPHWLRHMHVAVLSAAGVAPAEIQRRIGHDSITTTFDVYGGMIGDMNQTALTKGADIMAGRTTAPRIAD